MGWMAARGTGTLVFTDDSTANGSIRVNSEVYRTLLSTCMQPNAIKLIVCTVKHPDNKKCNESNPRSFQDLTM